MKSLATWLAAGAILGGAAVVSAPTRAEVSFSFGIGAPTYDGYNYDRPCEWYRHHDLPAPRQCIGYYRGTWGSRIFVDGPFVFRDRDQWRHWRDRRDYHHWRDYDWHNRWRNFHH